MIFEGRQVTYLFDCSKFSVHCLDSLSIFVCVSVRRFSIACPSRVGVMSSPSLGAFLEWALGDWDSQLAGRAPTFQGRRRSLCDHVRGTEAS